MKNAFKNGRDTQNDGYFDFYSLLIWIEKYTKDEKLKIESHLRSLKGISGQDLLDAIRVRSLMMHELTHYIDTTTSVWGMEYTYRKTILLKAIEEKSNYQPALSVFHLNTSELDSHLALRAGGRENLEGSVLKHKIEVDEKFGPVLSVLYVKDGEKIHQLPISMLSLLEAHATANEILIRIKDTETLKGDEKFVATRIIEREFSEHLNDSRFTEYSTLLYLSKIHFPNLSLRNLMRLFCAIATFSLNVSSIDVARLANGMGFMTPVAGPILAQDMRRGSSRQIIAFKLIIALHNWTSGEGVNYNSLLCSDPYGLIVKFYKLYFGHGFIDATNMELLPALQRLRRYNKNYPSFAILSESISYNRWRILKAPAGEIGFSNLKVMSMMLTEDGSTIHMPNQSKIKSEKIFEDYLPLMSNLENVMRENPSKKFFMPYEDLYPPIF